MLNYEVTPKTRELTIYKANIDKYVELCIANMRYEGLSEGTITNYGYYLKQFALSVHKNVEDISPIEIKLFIGKMQQRNNTTNNTSNNTIKAIRKLFHFLIQNEVITKNPMDKVEIKKGEKTHRKSMSREDLEELRKACENSKEQLIIEVMYSTGARIEEACNIKISDIDLRNKKIRVIGKGNKEGYLRLNPRAMLLVEEAITDSSQTYLFESRLHTKYKPGGLRAVINKIVARTNLSVKVTPHIIRHTTATLAYEAGMPITEVKALLRQENLDTTMRYVDIATESLDKDHRKYVL